MFQRILTAIDDTAAGEVALSFTTALARQNSATVRVFHANQYMVGGRGHTVETSDEAIKLVDDAVEELRDAGVPACGSVRLATCFTVPDRIVAAAHDWQADVIVLGSSRRRFLARLGGQGVRERVQRLTPLAVLTAPAPLDLSAGHRGMIEIPADLAGDAAPARNL